MSTLKLTGVVVGVSTLGLTGMVLAAPGDGIADFRYDPSNGQLIVNPDSQSPWSINFASNINPLETFPPAQWGYADFGDSFEFTDQFAGAFPLAGSSDVVLATLPNGLGLSDFGSVTYFILSSFDPQTGGVEMVPESTMLGVLGALTPFALFRRRRAD